MEKYLEVLKKCRLFSGLNDDNISAMLGCLGARKREYNRGQTIFCEGEPNRQLGIVLSGEVQILKIDIYGNRTILARIEPSGLFGESIACAEESAMPVFASAAGDSVVLLIEAKRITESCKNACTFHSQTIYNLVKILAQKNVMFQEKIEVTSKRTTREKLLTYLRLQAKKAKSCYITIPFDRQELADYIGVERSGLSMEISKLKSEKVIENCRSVFKLL